MSDPLDDFVALSAALTGFRGGEIYGTGLAVTYFDAVANIVGAATMTTLLAAADAALAAPDPQAAIATTVMDDALLGPVARNVIVLWYLGQWDPLPPSWCTAYGASPLDVATVVAPGGWTQALVWPAIGAHGMGGKPPGFGSWALKPGVDPARASAEAPR